MSDLRKDIMAGVKKVLIKVGTGVLTGKDGLDLTIIDNLVEDIAEITEGAAAL